MKRIFQIIALLILISPVGAQPTSNSTAISCNFLNTPLTEVLNSVQQEYEISFYYNSDWLEGISVSIQSDSILPEEFLNTLLKGTHLDFVIKGKRIFLFPDSKQILPVPDFETILSQEAGKEQDGNYSGSESNYLKGREPNMLETLIIGKTNNNNRGKKAEIEGHITDKETGEPLLGATVFIKELNKGAASDVQGVISLNLFPGKYTATFQCLGMTSTKCLLDVRSDGSFSLGLQKEITSIDEVTITAEKKYNKGSTLGLEHISLKTVKELPALMGEKDILRISQMLPGVVSVSEASAGINVRGGNADQNLFYFNDIPVYNTSHVFGFFSSINPSIVKDFSIFKGHVPAEYGGRLSSIFQIDTRRGNKKKFFAQGGVSPVAASLETEIPLIKDKCALVLSGRTSYSDWIFKQLKDPAIRNSSANFYDFAGSTDFDISTESKLFLFTYHSKDNFAYNDLVDFEYENHGYSANFQHRFNPKLRGVFSAANSNYFFATNDQTIPTESYSHNYKLNQTDLKASLILAYNDRNTISGGLNSSYYQLNRGKVMPFAAGSQIEPCDLGTEQGIETSLYIDEKFIISPSFNVYGGMRYIVYRGLGPQDIMIYQPGKAYDNTSITDTMNIGRGEKIVQYNAPEFRAAFEYIAGSSGSFKISYTEMSQYLFMLSNTISIAPADQWKLVDYYIDPPRSKQLALGYFKEFPVRQVSVSSEIYYKKSQNIAEYKDGAEFLSGANTETEIRQGEQDAYGFEFLLSKTGGRIYGWLSYSYSRSLITVNGANSWDKINSGETYPSNYDKPHVLNLVGNLKANRRIIFSTNLAYSTGRPVTLPREVFFLDGSTYVEYSKRNEYRVPDYFRIDLSLTVEGNLKVKKPFHSSWYFSVYNVTGRNNAHSIYFKSEEGFLRGYKYSVIGAPLYTITWNFKLGNYAAE